MWRWNGKKILEQLPVSGLGNREGGGASCWGRDARRKSRFGGEKHDSYLGM